MLRSTGSIRWKSLLAAALLLPTTSLSAAEGDRLPAESIVVDQAENAARTHLEEVRALAADQQWDEAVEKLRQVMEDYGDKLLPVEEAADQRDIEYPRYQTVRQYCQQRLARFHAQAPEALALYRQQVDPLAGRWYRQGIAERDETLLARVVNQMIVSSYGDDALLALGEIALEQGDYVAARWHWERISPRLRSATRSNQPPLAGPPLAEENLGAGQDPENAERSSGRPLWLEHLRDPQLSATELVRGRSPHSDWPAYPDTDLSLAEVRARLALTSILESSPQRAAFEIALLRQLHPQARGQLAGQEVDLAAALTKLLEESTTWEPLVQTPAWQTFAGNASRNGQAAQRIDVAGKLWETDLGNVDQAVRPVMLEGQFFLGAQPGPFTQLAVEEDPRQQLSSYPVVLGQHVYVADQIRSPDDPVKLRQRIRAFQLSTGQPAWAGGAEPGEIYFREILASEPHFARPHGRPRFTLTLHENILLARLGSPISHRKQIDVPPRESSVLVGLNLAKQGSLLEGFPIVPDDPRWAFEGTPVTDGRSLYVAMRYAGSQPRTHVASYELATGKLQWRRFICAAGSHTQSQQEEITHTLLTLVDGSLFVNTNLGAVAKLSAEKGAIDWLTRYPRTRQFRVEITGEAEVPRDLTPCVYHQGLLFVAPSDCQSLFAIDAGSGQMIWETQPDNIMHLLGVGQGNLLAAGNRLWWFDAWTGRTTGMFPTSENPNPRGFGRGALAGDVVYWPTREQIYVLAQQTLRGVPRPVRQPINLLRREVSSGNLVLVGDKMIISSPQRLQVLGDGSER